MHLTAKAIHMLEFENFQKKYGAVTVLRITSLHLEPGIHWIQGRNGSGKSTLLKSVAGIIHFDGSIRLTTGLSIKKQPVAYRQAVNFAESEPLYPEFFNGWDMIGLFSKAKGAPDEQVDMLINGFDMGQYLADPVGGYSSGMLKKLSLILAFLGNPSLILLDEPFITLDHKATLQLADWICEGYQQQQISFIITSHQSLPETIPLNNTFELSQQQLTAQD